MLEQYRHYVEMADCVSARRGLTNSFFLTLNTGIFTLIAAVGKTPPHDRFEWAGDSRWPRSSASASPGSLVRSYQLLNNAKCQVVGSLEERLPASPFWRAEWWALGEGNDRTRYWRGSPSSSPSPTPRGSSPLLYLIERGIPDSVYRWTTQRLNEESGTSTCPADRCEGTFA